MEGEFKHTSTLYVDVKETCIKEKRSENFSAPRYFKIGHTVAPSDAQAAPNAKGEGKTKKVSCLPTFCKNGAKSDDESDESATPEVGNTTTGCVDVVLAKTHISQTLLQPHALDGRLNFTLPNTNEQKIFKLGESGSGIRARGAVQDFYELRDYHVDNGTLFEDPEFPADSSSLTHNGRTDRHYEWLRPGEIVDDPQLFVEGYSRFDVQQGELGDCWLLAAVANLTLYRRLFFQIVPDDQGFDEKYAGIFHFRFWQYGRWIDVVIDDRLPTYRGQLVYLHSNEENEFWSALLEKAYAKLHGSYEALKGGSTCEAMEDFTGGVTEMYEMKSSPPNLFKIILKAYERGSLMGCSLEPDPHVLEAETPEGLIRGHAYSITRVKYVDIRTPNTVGKIPLLRLRNPWGNEIEWNGPWSDQSPEWRFIPDYEKTNLGLTVDHDGEFWMSLKDFQNRFDRVEICNLTPDSLTEEEISRGNMKQWEMSVFEGEWVRGVSSGGCRNFLETFPYNPQYRITLTEIDDDDEDNKCTVIIALLQKNRRSKKQRGVEFLSIGFAVFYLSDPSRVPKPLDLNYFKYNVSVARSPSFINLREVTCRFRLPPGTYCIVPSTYEPNEEGEFLLRVFSEKKNNMEMFDDPVAIKAPVATVASATPEKQAQDEKVDEVRQYFIQLAGDDMEIDWEELKDVLDFATRKEMQLGKVSVRNVEASAGRAATDSGSNVANSLIGFFCIPLCKNTPISEIVPNPVSASVVQTAPPKGDETANHGFSRDVCKSIVALLDADHSGKLGFEEFKSLWSLIKNAKQIFAKHDKDSSGSLSGFELRHALNSCGYLLNTHVLNLLMHRYGNKKAEIAFDEFILCALKLKTMIETFQRKTKGGAQAITLSFDDWIETTLYS
ncbi:calpain-A-like isoform X3 [Photinus pyralis]|nr:calpain-A-like isoform X3 [Photinus pyralis]